jgi:hypothetical protein
MTSVYDAFDPKKHDLLDLLGQDVAARPGEIVDSVRDELRAAAEISTLIGQSAQRNSDRITRVHSERVEKSLKGLRGVLEQMAAAARSAGLSARRRRTRRDDRRYPAPPRRHLSRTRGRGLPAGADL